MKRLAVTGNRTQDTWLVQSVLCHSAMTTRQPPALKILYMYCTGGTEMLQSHTWQRLLMERIFRSTPNGVLDAHTEWLPGVRLRHYSTTCAVHIQNCVGWWLSGCRSSVAEHRLHKPDVLGSIPSNCRPFHFPLFSPLNI